MRLDEKLLFLFCSFNLLAKPFAIQHRPNLRNTVKTLHLFRQEVKGEKEGSRRGNWQAGVTLKLFQ
jgi:hypothetical protein